ncbi:leucine-rich repeat protein kinase family protein [Striga asiatica]|uniref:Leucine-rich repeat protein kinase family protein n=1 Tax=Striga asiatica TaxID=4170 RepID=A0A5A7RCX5_STRAF|nr:leucine-rich repeat protein kinase family protein [Striga asiatica]
MKPTNTKAEKFGEGRKAKRPNLSPTTPCYQIDDRNRSPWSKAYRKSTAAHTLRSRRGEIQNGLTRRLTREEEAAHPTSIRTSAARPRDAAAPMARRPLLEEGNWIWFF